MFVMHGNVWAITRSHAEALSVGANVSKREQEQLPGQTGGCCWAGLPPRRKEPPWPSEPPLTCVGRHRGDLQRVQLTHADRLLIALGGHLHHLADVRRVGDNLLVLDVAVQM